MHAVNAVDAVKASNTDIGAAWVWGLYALRMVPISVLKASTAFTAWM